MMVYRMKYHLQNYFINRTYFLYFIYIKSSYQIMPLIPYVWRIINDCPIFGFDCSIYYDNCLLHFRLIYHALAKNHFGKTSEFPYNKNHYISCTIANGGFVLRLPYNLQCFVIGCQNKICYHGYK